MKKTIQLINIVILFLLIGCGGEEVNQQSIDEHFNGQTDNIPPPTSNATTFAFTMSLTNEAGGDTLNISNNSPGLISATLLNNSEPVSGVLVSFNLAYGLAILDPMSGTALTNENGVASIIINATDFNGADKITASIDGGISSSLDFSISALSNELSMSIPSVIPNQIGARGIATIAVALNENSNGQLQPYEQSVAIEFSSACVSLGLATIESPVNTINGIAQATYKDISCGQIDTINISTQIGQTILSQTTQLSVQNAAVGSIVFIKASNNFIALKGTGGSGGNISRIENSTLTFQVHDLTGSPASFESVAFSLSSDVGGLSLNHTNATTDANGFVDVIVQSGNVPSSVRVIASMIDNNAISTVSDLLVISTGVADYNSFSLAASELNVEAWNIDGIRVTITAHVADHFNNPVPDGTAILFNTEFGQIEPSCLTVNGSCFVDWTSSAPRTPIPEFRDVSTQTRRLGDNSICLKANGTESSLNNVGYPCFYTNYKPATSNAPVMMGGLGQVYGNRVTILAHMIGEESFTDTNGNGLFDSNEAYTDIPAEGFRDDNEDGLYGSRFSDGSLEPDAEAAINTCKQTSGVVCLQAGGDNEEYVDFNNNGRYDWQGNNLLNNVLCQSEGDGCTKTLLPIWKNITILQSGSGAAISIIEAGLDREDITNYFKVVDISNGAKTVIAYFADLHNGRMPVGTKAEFFASNGLIVGPAECIVLNSSSLGFEGCQVVIKKDEEDLTPDSGPLTLKVTTPSGLTTQSSISIQD